VTRGIDNIDPMAFPKTGGGSRSDGNSTLLLLIHPIHGGFPIVDLPHFLGDPGVKEDPLSGGGFTGVNMGHDANIAS
jgi:hypothetical protein